MNFVAIDVETTNGKCRSIYQIGLAVVEAFNVRFLFCYWVYINLFLNQIPDMNSIIFK